MNAICRLAVYYILSLALMPASWLQSLEASPSEASLAWSQGGKDFTAAFYPYAKKPNQNLIFSPLSLQLAMSMVGEIAFGETQKEIFSVACLPADDNLRQRGAQRMLNQFNTDSKVIDLALCNAAWYSTEFNLPYSLDSLLTEYYRLGLFATDFQTSAEGTRRKINNWVSKNTNSLIQNLMPAGSVIPETKFLLVNTLYMHASWANPFDVRQTYTAPFNGPDELLTQTPYMHKTAYMPLLQEASYSVVELRFAKDPANDTALALYVVLPAENTLLEDIEENMSTQMLEYWQTALTSQYVELSLPKFKISSAINAKKVLSNMGLSLPFSADSAEFQLNNCDARLVISNIIHQAVFEIDELGGTGAAATGVGMTTTSLKPKPQAIRVNRPFLVFIADKTSGQILFAGRVMQPVQ